LNLGNLKIINLGEKIRFNLQQLKTSTNR